MARLLLTGSAGLVGRAVRRTLAARGHEVIGLDCALPPGHPEHGDICQPGLIAARAARLGGDLDGILHFAAIARVGASAADPGRCRAVNVAGVRAVLEAARQLPVPPFVLLASSREVYGEPSVLPVPETAPLAPINVYGRSKAAAERLCMAARDAGLTTQIARFANVYGSVDDHPDRVVPAFARAAATDGVMHVRGRANAFDFTHADDVAEGVGRLVAALLAGERALPPIHFASGVPTRLDGLARLAQRLAGGRAPLTFEPSVDGTVARFWGDPSRARALLGWQATTSVESGLGRLIEAFRPIAAGRSLVA